MEIRYSTEAEAFYVTLGEGPVTRTVHISDEVMVDLKADGTVYGIEFLVPPHELPASHVTALVERFPIAADALAEIGRLTRLTA